MIHCVSTLPPPLSFLSYDLQLSSAYSTHQAEQNKQFSPLFPDKIPIPLSSAYSTHPAQLTAYAT